MEHFEYKEVLSSAKMNALVDELNVKVKNINGQLPDSEGNIILQPRMVAQFDTREDFPTSGYEDCVYLCRENDGLYRWDSDINNYKPCGAKAWPYPGPAVYNGVYIKYTDGTISPYDTLAEGKTPVGVAVIYENETYRLVMHPKAQNNTWQSPNGTVDATTKSGKTNTDRCLNSSYDCPAARWARDCVYADGSIGWLPSMEEFGAFTANITEVNTAMNLIGGTPIATADTWTSTENNSYSAWLWTGSGFSSSNLKFDSYGCRSVCAF